MTFDAARVRATREQLLLRLLFRATHTMNAEMAQRVRAAGHSGFQPSFTALLAHLDTEGTGISTLARRMGTSRQAVSQLLRAIEEQGLVERRPDPADKRGVIVRHTAAGRKILVDAIGVMLAIESEYTQAIGEEGLSRLKRLLKRLLGQIDPAGELAAEEKRPRAAGSPSE